ncbi:MAG: fibronectin type III-like domain-contianing protein, partial [Bacteroidota bacterium]
TSKYVDMPNAPLYPFGYGLSYTDFTYSDPKVDKQSFKKGETINVEVTVTNSGKRDGEEVVQLYIRDLVGSVTRPVKELKAFRKVLIAKGVSEKITFSLTEKDFSFFKQNMQFGAEAGDFEIMVGGSSEGVKKVKVTML